MDIAELVKIFKKHEYYKRMGKGKLARHFKCTTEEIKKAKALAYENGNTKTLPKVLILDIETSLLEGYFWGIYDQHITIGQIKKDSFIICYSAKWLFNSETFSDCVTPEEAKNQNDKRILKSLLLVMNEADIIITHNGNRFDLPVINTRLFLNGLKPVKPFQSIDTYVSVKKVLKLTSNKLDYLATILGIPNKKPTGLQLWIDCMNGERVALNYMASYNRHDVDMLESVYLKIRPWIKNHPNMALYTELEDLTCPNCGSTNLKDSGHYYTHTNKYKIYQCECGAYCRERISSIDKEQKQYILNGNLR